MRHLFLSILLLAATACTADATDDSPAVTTDRSHPAGLSTSPGASPTSGSLHTTSISTSPGAPAPADPTK